MPRGHPRAVRLITREALLAITPSQKLLDSRQLRSGTDPKPAAKRRE
jgi:hypothetical protein